jgi:hypothetical protein
MQSVLHNSFTICSWIVHSFKSPDKKIPRSLPALGGVDGGRKVTYTIGNSAMGILCLFRFWPQHGSVLRLGRWGTLPLWNSKPTKEKGKGLQTAGRTIPGLGAQRL